MDSSLKLYELLKDLLQQLPSLLMMLASMIFAVIRWRRHPRVSLMVLLSLGLLIGLSILSAVVYNWIPDWFIHSAEPANIERVARNVYLVLGLVVNSGFAIALALLLAAIFMQRGLANREV